MNSDIDSTYDPQKNKERYLAWKDGGAKLDAVSDMNEKMILKYVFDMERGINVNGRKKGRSYAQLNTLRGRMAFLARILYKLYEIKDITKTNQEQIHDLFDQMRKGTIVKTNGKPYLASHDYVKVFKAFWNWYMRIMRKQNQNVPNIVIDLYGNADRKPKWVYFTIEEMQIMAEQSKFENKALMYFLFDSGLRAPTELMNVRKSDLIEKDGTYELNIRDETSKTFGRRIKLMICSRLLKEYIKSFNDKDFIFKGDQRTINQYLSRKAKEILGKDGVTMYDYRHNSACYWVPRYKNESALKYRFGWKKDIMIHYYTEFLGMKDTIQEEDLLVDVTKSQIENQLQQKDQELSILKERQKAMESQIEQIQKILAQKEIRELVDKLPPNKLMKSTT